MVIILFAITAAISILYLYNENNKHNQQLKNISDVFNKIMNINVDISDIDDVLKFIESNMCEDNTIYNLLLYCLRTQLSPKIVHLCCKYVDITTNTEQKMNMMRELDIYGY